ncbi:helix-turn-helix domain-containing protein [Mycobacterium paraffinicum]|uniref:helix-turn-helix domain-containing protein n=1 Tax=Mycobacterium paraffinicum TaxID=53378 RepID=UPI0021F27EA9|nr:helix-turn-helix domain-containing protein [Mycobacterium paraffinicum]MCV7309032.1 helix-turn-helix domain-containing protein [Mycobacterium paraffinicum]
MRDGQRLQDRQVAALLDDGVPYRQVAAQLGLSLGAVQRAEKRYRAAADTVESESSDPVLSLLTQADMRRLGIAELGELDALVRFRFLSLPVGSGAGDAARALFDHGRGSEAFAEWCWADDPAGPRAAFGAETVPFAPLDEGRSEQW